jgi:hypothetical protein
LLLALNHPSQSLTLSFQLIVTGDFFQLPPVTKGAPDSMKFAFEAQEWRSTIGQNMFNLTQVFRQKDQGICQIPQKDRG